MNLFESRFWARVDMSGGPHACWPWRGYVRPGGYGLLQRQDGKSLMAHRVALQFAEPQPPSTWALHHCDNKPCCNPLHLYWGTPSDNANDRNRRCLNYVNGRTLDLAGQRFGRLVAERVVGRWPTRAGGNTWLCRCDCGGSKEASTSALRTGDTKSCGCLHLDIVRGPNNPAKVRARARAGVSP